MGGHLLLDPFDRARDHYRESFLPIMTEDALWQHLRGSSFTTPLLREWVPWLYEALKHGEG